MLFIVTAETAIKIRVAQQFSHNNGTAAFLA